jgi:L-ascorbate metabolism protein UlaG (beta-lactamase superfamily)
MLYFIKMEISWLGYSCFKLKGKNTTLITDPYPPDLGYNIGKPAARIVTVSHLHPGHSFVQAVGDEPKILSKPGEYEIGGVLIIGIPTYHDPENGTVRGRNTVYVIEIDDLNICHLGDLGQPLTSAQVEEIGNVDILLVPAGNVSTVDASTAAAIVRSIEPKIVVPMHYKTPELKKELEPVDKFFKEMGISQITPQPKLTVTKSTLPLVLQVVQLSY